MNIESLSDEIQRDKVQRARAMTLDERLTAGARLYAEQLRLVRDMVAGLHPDWTDAEVDEEMRRRHKLVRAGNEKGFYSNTRPRSQDLRTQS